MNLKENTKYKLSKFDTLNQEMFQETTVPSSQQDQCFSSDMNKVIS